MEIRKQKPSAFGDDQIEIGPVDAYVGGRARERRLHLNRSIADLAASIGLTPEQLDTFERGACRIGPLQLRALARALGVRIHYFFDRVDEDPISEGLH